MLRKALVFGLILSAPMVGAAPRYFAEDPPTVAGAPFSAVAQTRSTTAFSAGNRIVRSNTVHYFRDGQGRTRIERGTGQNRWVFINDPLTGQHYVMRPEHKEVFIYKTDASGPAAMGPMPQPDEDMSPFGLLGFGMGIGAHPLTTEASADTTSLGQKTVNGVSAAGTHLVRTIPVGALGNEKPITSTLDRWVSADLGIPVQIVQKSSLGGEITLDVGQVVRAEPDAALFTPPADYKRHDFTVAARGARAVARSGSD